jgi:hypothetical protein
MMRKKARNKAKDKKAAKRSKRAAQKAKDLNPGTVRKNIARIVEANSVEIAEAVVEEALKGQLAPAKYLWEMSGIYPSLGEGDTSLAEYEESLAETLMKRLGIPYTPYGAEEQIVEEPVKLPELKVEETASAEKEEELVAQE